MLSRCARGLIAFTVVSFVLAWLIALPLWLSEHGLADPKSRWLLPLMMLAPSMGAIAALFLDREKSTRDFTGLRLGERWGWYWAFAWLVIPLFCVAAPFVGSLFGVYELDLREFSGLREMVVAAGGEAVLDELPIQRLIALQLGALLIAPILNGIFAFGEEFGWRGYLLPALLPLGQLRALLLSGVIWGVWHAPVILLGHNYPNAPVLGVLLMTLFCVLLGVLFGWMRLATKSVWPAVIAHGALNGSAGVTLLFFRAGSQPDPALAGITGWTGWILPALVIAFLFATRRLPVPGAEPETG